MKDIHERLRRPFPESSIEYVVTFTYGDDYDEVMIGVAPYIKRESILVRLDHVCGPGNWKNELMPVDYGLYNGISIREEGGEWITKYDGAALPTGKNDNIDPVKSVATFSIRRTAELWGIGSYLKDLPRMFAVKRPSDYYQADEYTEVKRKKDNRQFKFKVRWDHPSIPAEFLPEFMTPEQYYLLKGLKKYFSEEQAASLNEILEKWTKDNDSVSYEEATEKITAVQNYIKNKVRQHNSKTVYAPPTGGNPPPQRKPKPKPQGATQKSPPPEKKATEEKTNTEDSAYNKKFKEYRALVKKVHSTDMVGLVVDRTETQAELDAIKKAIETKTPIPEAEVDKKISYYTRALADLSELDDDLPF